jgi:hypothetical protein
VRIAAGVITWQDGPDLLARACDSIAAVADELILCDGVVAGVDRAGLPALTEEWPPLPAGTVLLNQPHVTQSCKRSSMLRAAAELKCDWLLSLDADERYHEGRVPLRKLLATWEGDAFPLRFLHGFGATNRDTDPAGEAAAAWKLIRVAAWAGWRAGSCYLCHRNGRVYGVMGRIDSAPAGYLPYVTHHPEERAAGRGTIRLGVVEFELEPPPPWAAELPLPGFTAPSLLQPARRLLAQPEGGRMDGTEATYYCTQCGARFAGPGLCENGHPASEVQPLEPAPAAEAGQDQAKPDPAGGGSNTGDLGSGGSGGAAPALAPAPPAEPVEQPQPAVDANAVALVISSIRDELAHLETLLGATGT